METLLLCCSNPPTNFIISPPHVIRHVTLSPPQLSYSYSHKFNQLGAINNKDDKRRRKRVKCIGGGVREVKESEFEEFVLRSDLPVLVEFVANWCGPCRLISPSVLSLSQEYKDKLTIVKIDHDLNPNLIEEFKVYGLPTLILFKNGKVVPESRREGAITKVKLKAYVDSLLESISVA